MTTKNNRFKIPEDDGIDSLFRNAREELGTGLDLDHFKNLIHAAPPTPAPTAKTGFHRRAYFTAGGAAFLLALLVWASWPLMQEPGNISTGEGNAPQASGNRLTATKPGSHRPHAERIQANADEYGETTSRAELKHSGGARYAPKRHGKSTFSMSAGTRAENFQETKHDYIHNELTTTRNTAHNDLHLEAEPPAALTVNEAGGEIIAQGDTGGNGRAFISDTITYTPAQAFIEPAQAPQFISLNAHQLTYLGIHTQKSGLRYYNKLEEENATFYYRVNRRYTNISLSARFTKGLGRILWRALMQRDTGMQDSGLYNSAGRRYSFYLNSSTIGGAFAGKGEASHYDFYPRVITFATGELYFNAKISREEGFTLAADTLNSEIINSLVPVYVKHEKEWDTNRDLIFWFTNTPQLREQLKLAMADSAVQTLQKVNGAEAMPEAGEKLPHEAAPSEKATANPGRNVMWVRLFPNPATDYVSMEFSDVTAMAGVWQLVDMQGKIVSSLELLKQQGQKVVRLPLPQVPEGMYLLRVLSRGQLVNTQRLIIGK